MLVANLHVALIVVKDSLLSKYEKVESGKKTFETKYSTMILRM